MPKTHKACGSIPLPLKTKSQTTYDSEVKEAEGRRRDWIKFH